MPGVPGDLMVKSKLSPPSDSVSFRQLQHLSWNQIVLHFPFWPQTKRNNQLKCLFPNFFAVPQKVLWSPLRPYKTYWSITKVFKLIFILTQLCKMPRVGRIKIYLLLLINQGKEHAAYMYYSSFKHSTFVTQWKHGNTKWKLLFDLQNNLLCDHN